jgi:ATP-dependent DNA ligase
VNKNYYQGIGGAIDPLRIEEFDFAKSEFVVEEKYDGIWCDAVFDSVGKVTLFSRNQKSKDNEQLISLREYLENTLQLRDTRIQGELAFGSQKGTEFAKKYGHHKIDIFDVLRFQGEDLSHVDLLSRKVILVQDILKGRVNPEWINMGWYKVIRSAEEVKYHYQRIVATGGEGLVVKDNNDKEYQFGGKSKYWYRIKKQVFMDYVIMGYTETLSQEFRKRGWIGGVEAGLYVGDELVKKVTVGSMTHQYRELLSKKGKSYLGRVIEVSGNEVFKSGSMRHPSLARFRDDKSPEECTWEF